MGASSRLLWDPERPYGELKMRSDGETQKLCDSRLTADVDKHRIIWGFNEEIIRLSGHKRTRE